MSITQSVKFLRTVLLIDAATCVATGLLMTLGADIVAGLTAVPAPLLLYAGLSLFPVAIFIGLVGTRETLAPPAVWVVIVGNALWVAGSVLLLFGGMIAPNAWGYVFIGAQAAAVAVLAELEYFSLRQTLAVAHWCGTKAPRRLGGAVLFDHPRNSRLTFDHHGRAVARVER